MKLLGTKYLWVVLFLVPSLVWAEGEDEGWPSMDIPEGYTLVDRIVAQVQGELVTLHEVDDAVSTNVSLGATSSQAGLKERRKEALQALIDERLLLAEAEELQIVVTAEEIEQHLEMTRQRNSWSQEDLKENIARLGMTLDEYREVTRREKVKGKVIGVKVGSRVNVTPAEVQRVLDAEYGGGTYEEEARVSILVRNISPSWTDAQVEEGKRYVAWLRDQAEAAPNRFGDLARKFSEHEATRHYGGDLGYFRKGAFSVPALEAAAFDLPVGTVSPVLETSQGMMIVFVTDRRRGEVRDLEALKSSIFQRLFTEARLRVYQDWLEELRATAFIRTRL